MKFQVLCFLVVVGAVVAEETYSSEHDDFDVEALRNNNEKLLAFNNCFIGKSSCDTESSSFKKDLREAIEQACAKCTPAQKHILRGFIAALKEKFPQDFETFKQTYDPDNKYFASLEPAIANF